MSDKRIFRLEKRRSWRYGLTAELLLQMLEVAL